MSEKVCALCGQPKELQLSHIVPKFIINHLKKTSIGKIRNQEKAVQDGEKHYLLCHDCEELFSRSERAFANQIFYPYLRDHKDNFNYSKDIYYFITSLSWRSLYLDICDFVKEGTLKVEVLEKLIESEKVMRSFLLGKRSDLEGIEHHIFFFDRVDAVENIPNSDEINLIVHRMIRSYTGYQVNTIFTISDLCGILVITLYQKDDCEKWENTEIVNSEGTIIAKDQHIEGLVGNEIAYWCEDAQKMKKELPESDFDRMVKKLQEIGEDIKNFPIYQDVEDDRNLRKTEV